MAGSLKYPGFELMVLTCSFGAGGSCCANAPTVMNTQRIPARRFIRINILDVCFLHVSVTQCLWCMSSPLQIGAVILLAWLPALATSSNSTHHSASPALHCSHLASADSENIVAANVLKLERAAVAAPCFSADRRRVLPL